MDYASDGSKPVLVADDDLTFQLLLRRAVAREKLEEVVQLCRCGQDVRDAVGQSAPLCAVLDLNLGEENGLELAAWVREKSPATTILVQSWGLTDEARQTALAMGVEAREKERSFERLCQFLQDLGQRYPKPSA